MQKVKRFLCRVLGHDWRLYMKGSGRLRCCARCMDLQEYREFDGKYPIKSGWYSLVGFTKKHGRRRIAQLDSATKWVRGDK
jgi:hypothetical protein